MDRKTIDQKLDLVVGRLMTLEAPDASMDRETTVESQRQGLIARDFGIREWDWPQGVGLYGLLELQRARGNHDYDPFLRDWVERNLREGLPCANINTTAPFLTVLELTERYDLPELESLCKERADWLVHEMPRTKEGGFEHVTSEIGDRMKMRRNRDQIWADTLFMAVLFLARMGVKYQNQEWLQDAVHQYLLSLKYLGDNHTGLFYHGWTFVERHNFGGIFWCRGNSWFTYGAPAFLRTMEDELELSVRKYILDCWRNQVDALVRLQDQGGLWHTVLDDPGSYLETSGSGAITAGMLYGIRMGYLDQSYREPATRAVEALLDYIQEDGTVGNVSAGTGMGMNADHYRNILIRPMAYGQSLTALALTEALYL